MDVGAGGGWLDVEVLVAAFRASATTGRDELEPTRVGIREAGGPEGAILLGVVPEDAVDENEELPLAAVLPLLGGVCLHCR